MVVNLINGSLENATYTMDTELVYNDTFEVTASDIVGIWLTGAFCILGFAGNILSFIVLWRAFSRSSMFFVLRAVAISDSLFLLTVFLIQTVVNMSPYLPPAVYCIMYRGYIQYYLWPVMMTTQMSTVWLTVLVSAERYVAICDPLRAAGLCTMSKMRKCVALIFIGSLLFNVPRYWEFRVTDDGANMGKTDIGNNLIYRYLYNCVLYSLFLFLVPLAFLAFLNIQLVLALRQGKKQWKSLQFRQKKEQNLTIIPLTIVLIFFFCGTPCLVVNIIDSLNPAIWDYSSMLTFMVVSNFLVVLNSASNFIIYCLLGQTFRDKLRDLCQCEYGSSSYRVVHHLVNPRLSHIQSSQSTQATHARTAAKPPRRDRNMSSST